MKKLFPKKEVYKVKSKPLNPADFNEPAQAADFFQRGMAYYARNDYAASAADLEKSARLDNDNIDSFYCLGMVLKAMGRNEAAVDAFKQALDLLSKETETKTKNDMLRRLALGHINEITLGDWNLEKEIWQRST